MHCAVQAPFNSKINQSTSVAATALIGADHRPLSHVPPDSCLPCLQSGTTCPQSGIRCPQSGIRCPQSGIRCLQPSTICLQSGIRVPSPGFRCLRPATPMSPLGGSDISAQGAGISLRVSCVSPPVLGLGTALSRPVSSPLPQTALGGRTRSSVAITSPAATICLPPVYLPGRW